MNFDRLRHVSERADLGELNEMLVGVEIPEVPGSFKKFCRKLTMVSNQLKSADDILLKEIFPFF